MSYHKYTDQNSDGNRRFERLKVGTEDSGIILDITRKGVEINGYYVKYKNEVAQALLRKPMVVTWEDLDKMKNIVNQPKSKKTGAKPDYIIDEADEDYLNKLPKVHLNDNLYYVDIERQTIRPVDRPNMVYPLKK